MQQRLHQCVEGGEFAIEDRFKICCGYQGCLSLRNDGSCSESGGHSIGIG